MKKADNQEGKERTYKPLTLEEIHEAAEKRIEKIQQEFTDGFRLIEKYPRSVTFFGSSRLSDKHPSYKKAENLAKRIVKELNYSIFTGGGPGTMEAANKGAMEANGNSLGLRIKLPTSHSQRNNEYITDHTDFYYFFSRKVCLSFASEAYIFFPGGFGTMDELFEILTLVQTGKITMVPIILVGKSFWKPFDKWITKRLYKAGLVDIEDRNLFHITDNEDEIIKIIQKTPVRNGLPFDLNKQ